MVLIQKLFNFLLCIPSLPLLFTVRSCTNKLIMTLYYILCSDSCRDSPNNKKGQIFNHMYQNCIKIFMKCCKDKLLDLKEEMSA